MQINITQWLLLKRCMVRSLWLSALILSANIARSQVQATSSGPSGSYTTLNAAFAAINAGQLSGDVVITITGNTTEPATPTPLLANGNGAANYTSVVITPSGGDFIINSAASPSANRGVIELAGADNVTIDGDDPGTPGTQNLSIVAATSSTAGIACIRLSSNSATGADGADNITVKNCIITGSRSSATSTVTNYGIQFSDGTSTSSESTGANSSLNTLIQNNNITRCWYGIHAIGNADTYLNTGIQIIGNTIGSSTAANYVAFRGIDISYAATTSGNGALIKGNDIRTGFTDGTANMSAIQIAAANAGITITGNYIHDCINPSSGVWGMWGIGITSATSNTDININNNIIRDIAGYPVSSAGNQYGGHGIFVNASVTGLLINNNTIVQSLSNVIGTCVQFNTSGVIVAQMLNNIFVNSVSSQYSRCVYANATGNISGAVVNNNNYYVASPGQIGYYGSNSYATFSAWQSATGKDAASYNELPSFVSATDMHIQPGAVSYLESNGTLASGISNDFDNDNRPGPAGSVNGGATNPDIGADEFDGTPVTCYPPTGLTAAVTAGSATISWTAPAVIPGVGYELYYSTSSTAPTSSTTPNYTPTGTSQAIPGLQSATLYYAWVRSDCNGTDKSPWTQITFATTPDNDDCSAAVALTVNPDFNCGSTTNGTTLGATQSSETAPTVNAAGTNDDVWYSFVATAASHRIVLSNVSGSTDMAMAIYSGTCGSLVHIQSSDPNTMNVSGLTAGNTYYVRVYTYTATATTTASFTICVGTPPPPPANDDCSGAVVLTVNPDYNCGVTTSGTTVSATQSNETAPTVNAAGTNDDVWYKFTATATSHKISLSNVSNSTDMAMAIYSGSCGSLAHIQSSDPNTMDVAGLTPGNTYYVRVYTYTSTATTNATFDICIGSPPPPPANDECSGAVALTVNTDLNCGVTTSGYTYSATQSNETAPTVNAAGTNDDVWYSFVATGGSHRVALSNVSGSTDMAMAIYSGTCGSLVHIQSSDPNTMDVSGLTAGNTYYVRVYTYTSTATTAASFDICIGTPPVLPPPSNDECANAIALTPAATCTPTSATTVGATQSMAATPCNGNPDDDVWFSFVANAPDIKIDISNVVPSVSGGSTDMYFQVLSGSCGSMTSLLCSDPNSNILGGLTPGQTYYIRVYTYPNGFSATVTFDICLTNLTAPATCGTQSAPANNASVSGTPTLTWGAVTNAISYDVYMDAANPPTTLITTVTGATSYTIPAPLAAGDYYWYVVAKNSAGMATGCSANAFKFTVIAPPVNDEAPGAISLTLGAGCASTPYTNTYATQSPAEPYPNCKGTAGYAGMWYSFVAPASGAVKLSCDNGGTMGDSRMALYEASNVNDYTTFNIVACDDDNGVTSGTKSLFYTVGLTPGATYYVVVDLYGSTSTRGTYCVSVDEMNSSMLATSGTCAADQASVGGYNTSYHGWVSLVDGTGKLNANVRQTAGTATGFSSSLTVNAGALRTDQNGVSYLDRNFLVSGSGATSADLQLFYTDAELAVLNAAYGGALTIASLNVSRVPGTSCTATPGAASANATLLTQTASGSVNGVSWVQVTTPGFSNFYIHPGNAPLPIGLNDISAVNAGNRNRVDWSTATEDKGDYFAVERSIDGKNFSELTTIHAKGQAATYSYWDETPVTGINYYRLRLNDAAGRSAYSKVVAAVVKGNGAFTVEAHPNPVSDVLHVRVFGTQGDHAVVSICDVTGKVVSTISMNGNEAQVNMSNLPQGIYLLKYADNNHTQTIRVNKQ